MGGGAKKTGGKKQREESKKAAPDAVGGDEDEEEEEEGVDEVPFEKKVQFTEKVRRLTNEGLTRLVKKVKDICP